MDKVENDPKDTIDVKVICDNFENNNKKLEFSIKFSRISTKEDIIESIKNNKALNPKSSSNLVFKGKENKVIGLDEFDGIKNAILSDSFKPDQTYFIIQEELNPQRGSGQFEKKESGKSENNYDAPFDFTRLSEKLDTSMYENDNQNQRQEIYNSNSFISKGNTINSLTDIPNNISIYTSCKFRNENDNSLRDKNIYTSEISNSVLHINNKVIEVNPESKENIVKYKEEITCKTCKEILYGAESKTCCNCSSNICSNCIKKIRNNDIPQPIDFCCSKACFRDLAPELTRILNLIFIVCENNCENDVTILNYEKHLETCNNGIKSSNLDNPNTNKKELSEVQEDNEPNARLLSDDIKIEDKPIISFSAFGAQDKDHNKSNNSNKNLNFNPIKFGMIQTETIYQDAPNSDVNNAKMGSSFKSNPINNIYTEKLGELKDLRNSQPIGLQINQSQENRINRSQVNQIQGIEGNQGSQGSQGIQGSLGDQVNQGNQGSQGSHISNIINNTSTKDKIIQSPEKVEKEAKIEKHDDKELNEQTIRQMNEVFERSRQYESHGFNNQAIENYKEVVRLNPQCSEAYYSLGKMYLIEGNFNDTILNLKKAVELDSKFSKAYNILGIIFRRQRNDQESEYNYKMAIETNKKDSNAYNNLGLLYFIQGNYGKAEDIYKKALEFDHKNSELHDNLANSLKAVGRLDEALSHYKMAVKYSPNNFEFRNSLGGILNKLGRVKESLAEYQKSVEINEIGSVAFNFLGILYQKLEMYDEAKLNFEKAISIKPSESEYHNNLGVLYKKIRKFEDAERSYLKALSYDSDNTNVIFNLAILCEMQKRIKEAFKYYYMALKKHPKDECDILCNLGHLYKSQNDNKNAEICFTQATEKCKEGSKLYNKLNNKTI